MTPGLFLAKQTPKDALDLYLRATRDRLDSQLSAVLAKKNLSEPFGIVSDCVRTFALTIQMTLHNVGSLFLFYPFSEAFFSAEAKPKEGNNRFEESEEDKRHEIGLFYGVLEGLWSTLKRQEEGNFFRRFFIYVR